MAYLVEGTDERAQGAILDGVDWGLDPNPLSIVLSNECDLVNRKASFLIVAALVEAKETITESEEYKNKTQGITDNEVGRNKWETIKKFLDGYIYNKGITRYFFINPAEAIDAPCLLVDFQHIQSIPIEDTGDIEVVAQLPTPFKEQMMVQFASYTARIPVERDEDTTGIIETLIEPLKRKQ